MTRAVVGVVLVVSLWARVLAAAPAPAAAPEVRPELEFLKAVNETGPQANPQLLLLLVAQFASANRQAEGIEFLQARLAQFGAQLSDGQRGLYLASLASLRAGRTSALPPAQQPAWTAETARLFSEAKQLTHGQVFVVRWLSGLGLARDADALTDLTWCVDHADQAPNPGLMRTVYRRLAAIDRKQGNSERAAEFLQLSGLADIDPRISITTPLSTDPVTGLPVGAQSIIEQVPGKVFTATGFDFADLHFVVSDDRSQLFAIDTGTRPDVARAAYQALLARAPQLPPVTTVFITHSHPDHIGGHRFFRSLPSQPKFYARSNFAGEVAIDLSSPPLDTLRPPPSPGAPSPDDNLRAFQPDALISARTDLVIGGTRIELVPIAGGDSTDGMLIFLPDTGVMFTGDFAAPLLGPPFREEGSLDGLLAAFDEVTSRNPRLLLHGHATLDQIFPDGALMPRFKAPLAWLRDQVIAAVHQGVERGELQQANLIPPGLLQQPDLQLIYLLFRENVINRLYDQHVGPWQPTLEGVDALTQDDRGALLVDYLGVSEPKLIEAVHKLVADGRYELASSMLEWTAHRLPDSAAVRDAHKLVYGKLLERYQLINIFKLALYNGKLGEPILPLGQPPAQP